MRRYEVFIKPRSGEKTLKMRDIKAAKIGHLVTLRVRQLYRALLRDMCACGTKRLLYGHLHILSAIVTPPAPCRAS